MDIDLHPVTMRQRHQVQRRRQRRRDEDLRHRHHGRRPHRPLVQGRQDRSLQRTDALRLLQPVEGIAVGLQLRSSTVLVFNQSFGPPRKQFRERAGSLSVVSSTMTRPLKPWLSIDDQIQRLTDRGMLIKDQAQAKHALTVVGYYRLSGYWYPYREPDPTTHGHRLDDFVEGTDFAEVQALYEFDCMLKNLLLRGIERVEVAFRSRIGHLVGEWGPLAHSESHRFRSTFDHAKWWKTAKHRIDRARGRDETVDHHDQHYGGEIRNKQYWLDLIYEGERLTEVAEGTARDLSKDIADTASGRAQARRDGEQYRVLVGRDRNLDLNRPEHQLQDVIDAYR